ncbi:MAG: aldo/keto reductase [Candidatus Melainabacteria bacterium]|nr:aldo/keto reductase [Candidatus Melainabacteria bacterium]
MEKRMLGNTGMEVSVLGFGGAEIGFEGVALEDVERMLSAALDQGLNVIDTAECYMNSEELIGKTVSHRRNDFFLFTKCGHGADYTKGEWSYDEVTASINRSLKRLRVECVDLVQLHSCDEATLRKGEAIRALQDAKEQGKTRFIGYSGDHTDAIYAIETGAFDTLQTSVNIADQESIEITIPKATAKGMGVIAKRPIANAAWRYDSLPSNSYHEDYWKRLEELKYDFLKGDMEHAVEVALKFTLAVPGVHTAIVGTTKPGRWKTNANLLASGPISKSKFESIRNHWDKVSNPNWVGQV